MRCAAQGPEFREIGTTGPSVPPGRYSARCPNSGSPWTQLADLAKLVCHSIQSSAETALSFLLLFGVSAGLPATDQVAHGPLVPVSGQLSAECGLTRLKFGGPWICGLCSRTQLHTNSPDSDLDPSRGSWTAEHGEPARGPSMSTECRADQGPFAPVSCSPDQN